MKKEISNWIFVSLIMLLFSANNVVGLGISPAGKTIYFEPNLEKEVKVKIYNSEGQELDADIKVYGELSQYISLSDSKLNFLEGEQIKEFTYRINLPNEIEEQGNHYSRILVTEGNEDFTSGENVVSTSIAIVHQVELKVPFTGKYAEASLDVSTKDNIASFYFNVDNLGEIDINEAYAEVTILDQYGKQIDEILTDKRDVPKGKLRELKAIWNTNSSFGNYYAGAIIHYDDEIIKLKKQFTLGDFFLKLTEIITDEFELGKINKILVKVENLAYEEVKDVSARIIIYNENEEIINLLSSPVDISGSSIKEIPVFWDTKNAPEGIFNGELILSYNDHSKTYQVNTVITQDMMHVNIVGYEKPIIEVADDGMLNTFVFVLAIIVFIIILRLFIRSFKNKSGKE